MWAHPGLSHTRDTRAELYGPSQARDYLTVMAARPGWRDLFERTGAQTALVRSDSGLAQALLRDGWQASGSDAGYVLLHPAAG